MGFGSDSPQYPLHVSDDIRSEGRLLSGGNIVADSNVVVAEDVIVSGQVSMNNNIAWGENTSVQSYQDETVGANYQNIATSTSLTVKSGDILKIEAWATMRMTEGSGSDDFAMRVFGSASGGCSNFTSNVVDGLRPSEDGNDHDNFRRYAYADVHPVSCDGSFTFTLNINNNGADDWEVKDALIIVTKY